MLNLAPGEGSDMPEFSTAVGKEEGQHHASHPHISLLLWRVTGQGLTLADSAYYTGKNTENRKQHKKKREI